MGEETSVDVLVERVNNWMDTTIGYRKILCEKIDCLDKKIAVMNDKMSQLPCKERVAECKTKFSNINGWLKFYGATFTLVLAAIVGVILKR